MCGTECGQLKEWESFVAGALTDENKTSSIILGGQRPQNPNAQPQTDQSAMITESTADPRYVCVCFGLSEAVCALCFCFCLCLCSASASYRLTCGHAFGVCVCLNSSGQMSVTGAGGKDDSVCSVMLCYVCLFVWGWRVGRSVREQQTFVFRSKTNF